MFFEIIYQKRQIKELFDKNCNLLWLFYIFTTFLLFFYIFSKFKFGGKFSQKFHNLTPQKFVFLCDSEL